MCQIPYILVCLPTPIQTYWQSPDVPARSRQVQHLPYTPLPQLLLANQLPRIHGTVGGDSDAEPCYWVGRHLRANSQTAS